MSLPSFSNPLGGGGGGGSDKATFKNLDGKGDVSEIACQYNPTSLKLQRSISWTDEPTYKQPYGLLHYVNGASDKLTMTLLVDKSEAEGAGGLAGAVGAAIGGPLGGALASALGAAAGGGDSDGILPVVQEYYTLTKPVKISDQNVRPPLLSFTWMSLTFMGVIDGMDVEFVMFDDAGTPVRAMLTVTMQGKAFDDASDPDTFFSQSFTPS